MHHPPSAIPYRPVWVLGLYLVLLGALPVHADTDLLERFPQVRRFFPEADRFGPLGGEPPAAPVYKQDKLLGFVFLSADVVRIPGYSGRPINTLVAIDATGRIQDVEIVEHEEPILQIGVSDADLDAFIRQYRGKSVFDRLRVGVGRRAGYVHIDGISGATITVMVENATIVNAARRIARSRGLGGRGAGAAIAEAGAAAEPIWKDVWRERTLRIAVLSAGLAFLTLILFFQDWLARHPSLLHYVRNGYLLFTLFFIGWYALAQLSIVNVLTFVHSVIHGFRWDNFLIDPMMFILWSFVAVTLLLWGRGVYCGWLCPYGALQDFAYLIGRRFGARALEFSDVVHERLWAVKYIILLALFGISLQSLGEAQRYAEVEPFKTAVTMRFQREWPFVLYAAGFVLVSVFNRKFFCKYVCPLGAALTIPARFRIFDWLRRRKECGRPCQICATECNVRAIRPTGEINAAECHYCLDCQVTYWNAYKCPPLVEWRKRRERARRARRALEAGPAAN